MFLQLTEEERNIVEAIHRREELRQKISDILKGGTPDDKTQVCSAQGPAV